MNSHMEKRNDKRAELEENARFKLLGEEQSTINTEYSDALTKNISRGGLCMQVPYKIAEGNVIRVEIPVQRNEKHIKAFCEVQWCRQETSDKYEVGLSFIALKEEDADYLYEYVNSRAV